VDGQDNLGVMGKLRAKKNRQKPVFGAGLASKSRDY